MIQFNDNIVRIAEIRPESVDLDIRGKKKLTVLVDRTFDDLIHDLHAYALFFSLCGFIADILPTAVDIYGLLFPGMTDVFTESLYFGEPFQFFQWNEGSV